MINVGILGAGLFSHKKLLPAYQKVPEIFTYLGSNSKKGRSLCTYEEILQNKEISIVHIANSPHMHYQTLLDAIKSGKHVICEKPLCLTYRETMDIMHQSQKLNTHIQEGLSYRFHPQWAEILRIVETKELGAIRCMQTFIGYAATNNMGHRNIEGPGSGIFWDLACYPVDASTQIESSKLVSIQSTVWKKNNITNQSNFLLQFASGVTSCVILDMNSQPYQSLRITFENGTILSESPFIIPTQGKVSLRIKQLGKIEKIHTYKNINVYQEQLAWFIKKVQTKQTNDPKILESAKILATICDYAFTVES